MNEVEDKIQIEYLKDNLQFLDEIAELWCKEWSESWDKEAVQKKSEKLRAQANSKNLPILIIAKIDNILIGTAALFENDLESHPELTPWVGGIFVKDGFRGQGIASMLVNKITELGRLKGFSTLYLHTETASGLYEKLGWAFLKNTHDNNDKQSKIYFLSVIPIK